MCIGNCKNCKCKKEEKEKESIFQPCPKCQGEIKSDENCTVVLTSFPAQYGVMCNSCGWKGFFPTKKEIELAAKWLTNVRGENVD